MRKTFFQGAIITNIFFEFFNKKSVPGGCCGVGDLGDGGRCQTDSSDHSAHRGRHQAGDPDVSVGRQAASLLFVEVVDCQDVGGDHDQHRDVEGEQGPEHQEIDVVELTPVRGGHVVGDVDHGEDRDGAGQEEPQTPGEADFVEDVVLSLCSVVERSSDAPVSPDRNKHEVKDADGAGQHVTGLVKYTPTC